MSREIDTRPIFGTGGHVAWEIEDDGTHVVIATATAEADSHVLTLTTEDGTLARDYYAHPYAYAPASEGDPFSRHRRSRTSEPWLTAHAEEYA